MCAVCACFCSIPACIFGSRFRKHDRHHDRMAYRRCLSIGWIAAAVIICLTIIALLAKSIFGASLPDDIVAPDRDITSGVVLIVIVATAFLLTAILAFLVMVILWNERANEAAPIDPRNSAYKPHKEWGVPTFGENDPQFTAVLAPTGAGAGVGNRSPWAAEQVNLFD